MIQLYWRYTYDSKNTLLSDSNTITTHNTVITNIFSLEHAQIQAISLNNLTKNAQ